MMTIVIVEDNDKYSQIIQNMLDGFARKVVVVKTWEEAKPYLDANPDVAWIDLQLPDSDADQTMVRIGELRSKDSDIVIIVVSGHIDEGIEKLAREARVDAIEQKGRPGTRQKLLSLIMLAMVYAKDRGAKRRLPELLEHVAKFVAETFPQQQTT
jgi:CheY-like chemotaxis protein